MPTRSTSQLYYEFPLYDNPIPQIIVRDRNGRQLHLGDTVRIMPEQIHDMDYVVKTFPRFAQAGLQGRIEEFHWEDHLKLDTLEGGYINAKSVEYVMTHEISDSAMLSLLGQT